MKIVQTLWTGPGLKAGWTHEGYHLMSWALSCLQLRQFYDEVELYTDSLGKHILIDCLGLPYTKVHLTLDEFPYPEYLWALPKIKTYDLQDTPFLHVDGDVYIWEPFDQEKIKADFVCQNIEVEENIPAYYTKIFQNLWPLLEPGQTWPEWIKAVHENNVAVFNAGVFGGNHIPFFKKHAQIVFKFIEDYSSVFPKMKTPANINQIVEQFLSRYLIQQSNLSFSCLILPFRFEEKRGMFFEEPLIDEFGISNQGRTYVHLFGEIKRRPANFRDLARCLQANYPSYFQRVVDHLPDMLSLAKANVKPAPVSTPSTTNFQPNDILQVYPKTIKVCQKLGMEQLRSDINGNLTETELEQIVAEIKDRSYRKMLKNLMAFEKQLNEFKAKIGQTSYYQQLDERLTQVRAPILEQLKHKGANQFQLAVNPGIELAFLHPGWVGNYEAYISDTKQQEPMAAVVLMWDWLAERVLIMKLKPMEYLLIKYWSPQQNTYEKIAKLIQQELWSGYDEELLYQSFVRLIKDNILQVEQKIKVAPPLAAL